MIPNSFKRVTVIGAGPAGLALAADLEMHGMDVLVYSHPSHSRHANAIIRRGYLKCSGKIEGVVCPLITYELEDAVQFSTTIILAVPSTAQDALLKSLGRFDLRYHSMIAIPGNLFSLVADAVGIQAFCFYETNLSPYACRISKEGHLVVSGRKHSVNIASANGIPDHAFIARLFPTLELNWCHNIVEVSLTNINGVFHPLMNLMNAGRIESTNGDFCLYRDGLTKSVVNAIEAIDAVRIQIGQCFGYQMSSTLETSNACYGHDFVDLLELAQHSGPHKNLRAPNTVVDRNVSEDVPNILVTWHDMAERLNIDSSPIKAVITLASISAGIDYAKTGRSMANLGLAGMSRHDILTRFGAR